MTKQVHTPLPFELHVQCKQNVLGPGTSKPCSLHLVRMVRLPKIDVLVMRSVLPLALSMHLTSHVCEVLASCAASQYVGSLCINRPTLETA